MSDDISKKIIIDVEINDNGQQQIDQYKTAFDSLKNSLNDIKKPLYDLSNNIDTLGKGISGIGNASGDTKNKIADVTSSFSMWNGTVKALRTSFDLMNASISAGLSILITYGPEILKWITSLIKGKEAINQATLSLGVMNKALQSTDYSNAIQQVTQLKTNISLAKKGFLDKKTVLEQYNKTLGQTMGKTNDLNQAEKILISKGDAYIKITLLKAEAQLAFQNAAQKAVEAEQEKHKSVNDELSLWDKVKVAFSSGAIVDPLSHMNDLAEAASKKAEQNRQEAINDLNKQKDTYTKIAGDFETQAAKISKALHLTDTDNGNQPHIHKPKTPPKTNQASPSAPPGGFPVHQPQPDDDPNAIPADVQAANDAYQEQQAQKTKEQALKTTKDIIDGSNAIKAANEAREDQERQERDKKRVEEAKQVAEQLAHDALNVLQNSIAQQSEAKINALEKDQAAELNNSALTSTQKAAIEQKYRQQENQIRAKAFKEEQELSIAGAIMNGPPLPQARLWPITIYVAKIHLLIFFANNIATFYLYKIKST